MAKLLEVAQVGKREHKLDVISLIDAKTYPFTSMANKRFVPENTLVEWQADALPEPSFDGVLDGKDATVFENMAERRAMLQTRVQIFERKPMVSFLAEKISNVAGVGKKKEMARAVAQALEALKRDMECAFCSDRESQQQVGEAPYRTRGLGKYFQSAAQTDLPIPEAYRTPTGSISTTATATLADTDVNAVLQSMWSQTGKVKRMSLLAGMTLRSRFSKLTQTQFGNTNVASAIKVMMQNAESKKLMDTIDSYEGDFGTFELVPSDWLARDSADADVRNQRGYAIDFDLVQIGFLGAPERIPLQDGGGGPRELIRAVASLLHLNPLAGGKFAP